MSDFLKAIRAERSHRERLADLAKHMFTTTLNVSIGGNDDHEVKLVVRYDVSPGEPEIGRRYMGHPDDYDPGSAPEVHIRAIRISDGDDPLPLLPWLERIILADDCFHDALVKHALEGDA